MILEVIPPAVAANTLSGILSTSIRKSAANHFIVVKEHHPDIGDRETQTSTYYAMYREERGPVTFSSGKFSYIPIVKIFQLLWALIGTQREKVIRG